LGLTFIDSPQFPADWQGDLFVSYHGSWNRSTPTGYKVVRLHVSGNMITGSEDFMTGFLQDGTAVGRPVDVIFDKVGNLYVSDDKAGKIYIVSKK
jgi:glucose/arabinose dehydrogenase